MYLLPNASANPNVRILCILTIGCFEIKRKLLTHSGLLDSSDLMMNMGIH